MSLHPQAQACHRHAKPFPGMQKKTPTAAFSPSGGFLAFVKCNNFYIKLYFPHRTEAWRLRKTSLECNLGKKGHQP